MLIFLSGKVLIFFLGSFSIGRSINGSCEILIVVPVQKLETGSEPPPSLSF